MMRRSCLKTTVLCGLGAGFAMGSVDFLRRGNVGIATRMALLASVGTGAFVKFVLFFVTIFSLLCQTKNVSKDISGMESYWEYKRQLDERLKRKYEQ